MAYATISPKDEAELRLLVEAMPTPTAERKIYFYRARAKKDGAEVDPTTVLSSVNSLPPPQRRYNFSDGNAISLQVDSPRAPWRVRIGKIRRTDLPLVERQDVVSPISLPEDTNLYEPSHFVLFQNRVIGFEFNIYGPRATALEYYIPEVVPEHCDEFEILPFIRRNITEMLGRVGEVRLFRFKAHRDMGQLLEELQPSLKDGIDALGRSTTAEYFDVTFKPEPYSRESITLPFMDRLASWIQRAETRAGIDALKIEGVDSQGRPLELDLLQQFVLSKKRVIKVDEVHRAVDTNAMHSAIIEAYHDLRAEIESMLGSGP
jgi:hypothetical protein